MARVEKSIEISAPVNTVYNQWTQFEEFPNFMEGVREVRQLDDTHLQWHAQIAGRDVEWRTEITEQIPDKRIAWRSTSGATNAGTVDFHRIDDHRTLVSLIMDYEPEGAVENVGDALGVFSRRIEGDLQRFKEFIESRGRETGAWRGEVRGGQARGQGRRQTDQGHAQALQQRHELSGQRRGLPSLFGSWDDPFAHMRRMSQEMDILFERLTGLPMRASFGQSQGVPEMWSPQVEITQRGDELVVRADLPGVKKDDVQVELADDRLIIQGERRTSAEHHEGGVHRSERSYGHFYREIPLPEQADRNDARASMKDGVLEICVRSPQRGAASRRLEISEAREEDSQQTSQRRENLPL